MSEFKQCQTVGDLIDQYVGIEMLPADSKNRTMRLQEVQELVMQELYVAGSVVWRSKVWFVRLPVRMDRFDSFSIRDAYQVATSWTKPLEGTLIVNAEEKYAGFDGSETPS